MPRFLEKLELSRIPGVGKKFLAALAALGIRSVPDVLARPEPFWERRFGKAGMALLRRAQGVDGREVVPYTPPKSESAETTFERDTRDRDFLKTWLLRHAERVGARMRRHGFAGRTVTLKIKYAGFRTVTRQMRLAARTSSTESLYEAGCALLDALSLEEPVRLIGLGISGFDDEKPIQLSLMDAMPGGESAAETERRRRAWTGRWTNCGGVTAARRCGAAGSSRGMRLNARGRKAAFRTCLSGTGKIDRRRLRRRGGPWAGKQSCVLSCLAAGAFSFFKVGNTSGTEQPAEPVGKFRRVAREFSFHPFEKRAYAGRTSGFFRTGRNVTPG